MTKQRTGRTRSLQDLLAVIAAAIENPENWIEVVCPRCQEPWAYPSTVAEPESKLCPECSKLVKAEGSKRAGRDEILRSAGVPELFRQGFTEPEKWPNPALPTWTGSPWCVVLAGIVSGGKTMLGTELLYRAASQGGREAAWTRAGSVPRLCFDRETGSAAFDRFATVPVLLLDDLGRGHDGRAWGVLVEIISERHQHQRATIITTNRPLTRRKPEDQPGLFEEDAAAGRRMAEGLVVVMRNTWKGTRDQEPRK